MVPTVGSEAGQVVERRFRARQHQHVRVPRQRAGEGGHHEVDGRLHPQGIEVVGVRNARQERRHDLDAAAAGAARPGVPGVRGSRGYRFPKAHRVLRRQPPRRVEPRHDAAAGPAGAPLDLAHAVGEAGAVAPEAVDCEARDQRRVGRVEHDARADEGRDGAAPVDVREQADRCVDTACEAHVGDVVPAQIGLGGAAGALDHDQIGSGREPLEALEHGSEQTTAAVEELAGRPPGQHPPPQHDLRGAVRFGLQQHRIHVDGGGEAGGARLQRLRASYLPAAGAGGRVVRHVLRLERRDREAPPPRQPAEPRHHGRLAGVRAGGLDHQHAPSHAAPSTVTSQSSAKRRTDARTP